MKSIWIDNEKGPNSNCHIPNIIFHTLYCNYSIYDSSHPQTLNLLPVEFFKSYNNIKDFIFLF